MTFLNPAVLFGLIAASIPVLIHLLNLRKLKKIEFSTLMFLKELQKNKIRKIKLKQWILLALRVLIILFLVTAFARPTLEGISIGGAASVAKTTAVFIIDNTFSMEVIDSRGSYINQSKSIAIKLLNLLKDGDDAAIIFTGEQSSTKSVLTNNLEEIKRQINNFTTSDISGTIHSAVIKAATLLEESKNFNKEIYIISDLQESRLANEKVFSDFSELLNDKVRLYFFSFPLKDVFNSGIDNLKLNSQIFQKDKTITLSAFVTNYSNHTLNNFVVSLFINGERSAQKSITLNAGETKEVEFESVIKNSGFNEIFIEIEDDELMRDNRRYAAIVVPDKLPLLILNDSPDDSRFIQLALSAGDSKNFIEIEQKSLNLVSSIDINRYEAIIINGSEKADNLTRLKEYLKAGGGLLFSPGSKSTISSVNKICSELNIPQANSFVELKNSSDKINFSSIDYEHPLFGNLFSDKRQRKIESPDIYSYFRFFTAGAGKNIIGLNDNSSFLAEYKYEKGKILLMSVCPNIEQSNLPLKNIFVPLIYKSVLYLSSREREDTNLVAGNKYELNLSRYVGKQIKVIMPRGKEENIAINNSDEGLYFSYDGLSEIGNYKFFSGNKLSDYVSVNANPLESVVKYMSDKELKDYLQKIKAKSNAAFIKADDDIVKAVKQARYGSELWKMFLILAFLIALIEMFVAKSAKKDMAEIVN